MLTLQRQWKAVMGQWHDAYDENDANDGADFPVSEVDWNACHVFCERLGRLVGHSQFALPTEAQWEFACRAGTTTAFNNGVSANELYGDLRKERSVRDLVWISIGNRGFKEPVGVTQRNAWNLSDMHGNGGEWCCDWYGDYSCGLETDPKGPLTGRKRVVRGGRCSSRELLNYRVAIRDRLEPDRMDSFVGFRPVIVSDGIGQGEYHQRTSALQSE